VLITASRHDSYRQDMQLCWTKVTNERFNWMNWLTFFIPTLFYYFFSIFTVIYAALRLRKGLDQTFATRQAVLRNGIRYVAGFCAYWTFAGIIYGIINLKSGPTETDAHGNTGPSDSELPLYASFAVTIAFRGVVDVVIWIYNQRVHKIYALWWAGLPHDSPADVGLFASDINRALRSEVLIFSTTGIALAIEEANRVPASNQMPTAEDAYPVGLDPFPREPRNMHSVVEITVARGDFSARSRTSKPGTQVQRMSSLASLPQSPTNASIASSADGDSGSSSSSSVAEFDSSRCDASLEKVPFLDYAPQVFRYLRLLFGIDERAYARSIQGRTEAMVEKFTEGRGGAFFYFSEDSQYIVKTLTRSEGQFLTKFLPSYVKYMAENPSSLLARFVGFHAITLYNLTIYIIVQQSVFLTPRKIHERYDLKGSTVDRHAAKPKPVRQVPPPPQASNSPGGASGSGGEAINPATGQPTSGGTYRPPTRRGAFRNVVFKDNDLNRTVRLAPRDRETFLRQVRRDAFFLRSCNIMDYSLLLGVHHTSHQVPMLSPRPNDGAAGGSGAAHLGLSPSQGGMHSGDSFASNAGSNGNGGGGGASGGVSSLSNPRSSGLWGPVGSAAPPGAFQYCDGGVQASIIEGPGIYFFGIIDILQEYNTSKKLEHFAKIYLRCKGSGISAIPPLPYAQRFVRFMADITRSDDDDVVAAQNRGVSMSRPAGSAQNLLSAGVGMLGPDGSAGGLLGGNGRAEPLLPPRRSLDSDSAEGDEPDSWEAMEAEDRDRAATQAAEGRRASMAQRESDRLRTQQQQQQLAPSDVRVDIPAGAAAAAGPTSPSALQSQRLFMDRRSSAPILASPSSPSSGSSAAIPRPNTGRAQSMLFAGTSGAGAGNSLELTEATLIPNPVRSSDGNEA